MMQLTIEHTTHYQYSEPLLYSIQQLRLTPQDGFGQKVKHWTILVNGQLFQYQDAHGNVMHQVVVDSNHQELKIVAKGEVETGFAHDRQDSELPLQVYLRHTRLTDTSQQLVQFAQSLPAPKNLQDLLAISRRIIRQVPYQKGSTEVYTTASEALATGKGVCQDHAHIFISLCRLLDVPARYVSGYLYTQDGHLLESHAWADAWIEQLGWVSVDVSNCSHINGSHVRLATGLDYHDACPVSGIRVGGGDEQMQAQVHVNSLNPGLAAQMAQSQQQ